MPSPKSSRKPAPSPTPRPGDIYAQRSTDTGKWCAYQVTHTHKDSLALLTLDWVGDAPPTPADFPQLRPLNNTRYYFSHGISHSYVNSTRVPDRFELIGNHPPIVSKKTNSYCGSWPQPREQCPELEAEWRARDPERLRRFEAARNSGRELTLAGQTVRDTFTRVGPELIGKLDNIADLDQLPRLLEIEVRGPRPDLIAYLRTHDLLYRLEWNAHGQRALDFRGVPHLNEIALDATGLETLHLPDTLAILKLTGTPHPKLRIHSHNDGAALFLEAPPAIGTPGHARIGLAGLNGIRIAGITQLDLAPIVARHPALQHLTLAGKPGTLANVSALARLRELRRLYIDDLFAYAPADIPPPDAYPHLEDLCLESIPADVAAHVKKLYAPLKKSGALDLDVRKPRAAEWLAENLDNPFRDWDGSEFVTPANARRAFNLYKKTRVELRAHLDAPDAAATLPAHLEKLVRDWAAAFNAWDKRTQWIETEERETICTVVEDLLIETARRHLAAKIDIAALMETFDELRDF